MSASRDLAQIPHGSSSTALQPAPPLMGRAGWLAIVLLVAACACGAALVMGCNLQQLAPAKTAANICHAVEGGGAAGLYTWESECEAPIVAEAVATGDADASNQKLAAQRAKLKPLQAGLDGVVLVCSSLSTAIKIAEQQGQGSIADDIITAVFSTVIKFVKLLMDAGVKLPPTVTQLVQQA